VVRRVSCAGRLLADGEKIVVCDPSGSGKSTLIRCINRIERHDGGRIVFDGTMLDDSRSAVQARKGIGMVFQQFNLFPHLTVLDNVMMAPTLVKRQRPAAAHEQALGSSRGSASPSRRPSSRGSCRAGSSNGWPSPA
jgi:ABC-type polar amino acid transport system ATPase subunit